VTAWAAEQFPRRDDEPAAAHARAIKAKALDLVRGLLPASSLSHMGIFATGQSYEQLILHLLGHPLPEARSYGQMVLTELQAVMPSFLTRVERPDRGGQWIGYLEQRTAAGERWAERLGLGSERDSDPGPSVELLAVHGDEDDLLTALLFEQAGTSERAIRDAVVQLDGAERAELLGDLVGQRQNRRHRPGRGFEAVRYRFEIVSDYGAFRDLQRHRMLTVQWQALTPDLGAGVPEQVELAGCGDEYRRALEISAAEYERLHSAGLRSAAPYALCLGYRIRYVLDLNAREAMQLIELRSGREGHPSYRAVAHEMHEQIAEVHPAVAGVMTHVDRETEPRLERILSELRTHHARARGARAPAHASMKRGPGTRRRLAQLDREPHGHRRSVRLCQDQGHGHATRRDATPPTEGDRRRALTDRPVAECDHVTAAGDAHPDPAVRPVMLAERDRALDLPAPQELAVHDRLRTTRSARPTRPARPTRTLERRLLDEPSGRRAGVTAGVGQGPRRRVAARSEA
jgi:thymidylate synthase ThyX